MQDEVVALGIVAILPCFILFIQRLDFIFEDVALLLHGSVLS